MQFTFYHSSLCPRCARLRKHLHRLLGQRYSSHCVEIDSLKHPLKTWQAGIRMIPALQCGDDKLSAVLLSEEQIRSFLYRHGFEVE